MKHYSMPVVIIKPTTCILEVHVSSSMCCLICVHDTYNALLPTGTEIMLLYVILTCRVKIYIPWVLSAGEDTLHGRVYYYLVFNVLERHVRFTHISIGLVLSHYHFHFHFHFQSTSTSTSTSIQLLS